MLNQYIAKVKHEVEEDVVVDAKRTCDICGAVIDGPYFEVTTSHREWGNDSVDSYTWWDCCDKCITKMFAKYLIEVEQHPTLRIEVNREKTPLTKEDQEEIQESFMGEKIKHIYVDGRKR